MTVLTIIVFFYKTVKPSYYPPRKFTTAHFHELLTELISESSLSENNEVNAPKDEPDSESTWLVNSTSSNSINPGDGCKLMPTPDKGKARVTCSRELWGTVPKSS